MKDKLLKLKLPTRVNYEITYLCNQRCCFCYNEEQKGLHPTLSDIKKILDKLFDSEIYNVVLTGGEPTSHPDFLKILEYMKDKGFSIGIVTNITLITKISIASNKD